MSKERYKLIINQLDASLDYAEIILLIDQFITDYGKETFLDYYSRIPIQFFHSLDGCDISLSMLSYAVYKNNYNVVKKLLEIGVPINKGAISRNSSYDRQSPLMLACQKNYVEIVKILLQYGADIFNVSRKNINVLMLVRDSYIFELICDAAEAIPDGLRFLAASRTTNGSSVYNVFNANHQQALSQALLNREIVEINKNFFSGKELQVQKGIQDLIRLYQIFPDNIQELLNNYLISACVSNDVELVSILLDMGANVLTDTNGGKQKSLSLLMLAKSVDICELLIIAARAQGNLHRLLKKECGFSNVYLWQCKIGNPHILETLIQIDDYHTIINIKQFLAHARIASWLHHEKHLEFDELCIKIRTLVMPLPILDFDLEQTFRLITAFDLFSAEEMTNNRTLKARALRNILLKIAVLFSNPKLCMQYLKFLNDEFMRYYQEKYQIDFSEVDYDSFKFELLNGLFYPIPKANYIGIHNKHSSLQEYFICLLKKHGLQNNSYEWMGFIPHSFADQIVRQGGFFTESRIGVGLFHGKFAHMLQFAMILYAIEDGDIDLSFKNMDQTETVTLEELLDAFVTLKDRHNNSLWLTLRDKRVYSRVDFCDPYRLSSVIMSEGKNLELNVLSAFMIDSFCKGWNKNLNALRHVTAFKDLTTSELLVQLNDLELRVFQDPAELIEYALNQKINKKRLTLDQIETKRHYAIIPKTYNVNTNFEPRFFSKASVVLDISSEPCQSANSMLNATHH